MHSVGRQNISYLENDRRGILSALEVKITTDPKEIREAQRLRFEVFNLEMNKGLEASYASGLDGDEFDPICDHLIVRDLKSQEVVGTYRLLLGSQAERNLGFYSERGTQSAKYQDARRRTFRAWALLCTQGFSRQVADSSHVGCHRSVCQATSGAIFFGCGSVYTTEASEAMAYFFHAQAEILRC